MGGNGQGQWHKASAGPRLGHAAKAEEKPACAQERQSRPGFAEGEEGAGLGMSHGGCHSLEMAFVGGKAHGWWDSSSVGQEGPWGTHGGEEPSGSGGTCAVLSAVLVCWRPTCKTGEGPEIMARSPPGCPQRDGRALALPAHSTGDGATTGQQLPPGQRTWGSSHLGRNPSISILSPENFPACFLVDTPVKPTMSLRLVPPGKAPDTPSSASPLPEPTRNPSLLGFPGSEPCGGHGHSQIPWPHSALGQGLVLWALQCRKQGEVGTPPAPTGALPTAPVPLGWFLLLQLGRKPQPCLLPRLSAQFPPLDGDSPNPVEELAGRWGCSTTLQGSCKPPHPQKEKKEQRRRRKVQFPSLSSVPPSCRLPACRDPLA